MNVGKVKDTPMYKTQPINVDLDPGSLEKLKAPISLEITREAATIISRVHIFTYHRQTRQKTNNTILTKVSASFQQASTHAAESSPSHPTA